MGIKSPIIQHCCTSFVRNNLKAMKKGDKLLFYHSVIGKEKVGIAEVTRESYPDPTTDDERWVVVDLKPLKAFKVPVSLEIIKTHKELSDIPLIKQSRLSVMPIKKKDFQKINNVFPAASSCTRCSSSLCSSSTYRRRWHRSGRRRSEGSRTRCPSRACARRRSG